MACQVQHVRARLPQPRLFQFQELHQELQTAIDEKKPLVLVHDADQEAGGSTLETLKKDCPDDLRDKVFESGHPVITWLRTPDFQDGVAQHRRVHLPLWGGQQPRRHRGHAGATSVADLLLAAQAVLGDEGGLVHPPLARLDELQIEHAHHRLREPEQPGATELMEELNEYLGKTHHLQVTNMKPELIVNGVRELQLQRLASTQSARSREVSVEQLLPGRFFRERRQPHGHAGCQGQASC